MTLDVIPIATTVSPGSPVSVDVVVSGLSDLGAASLGTFDLDLLYDSTLFSFTSATYGPELGDPLAAEALVTTTPGGVSVNLFELSLLAPATLNANQRDTFTLFTATFDAIATGSGVFDLSSNALGDENGAPLVLDAVTPTTIDVENVALTEIPTLSEWMLVGFAALLLLAGSRRLWGMGR